jgi:hypothetical protein
MDVQLSWDLTILMLTMYYTFMIPYRLAFIETIEPYSALNIIEQTFNAFFYIDLVINFCTAVQEGPVLKETHSEIAASYLQSWFIIDLISCFPFDELAPEAEGADGSSLVKSFKLIRLIKTLRIIRATRALKKVLDVIQLNPSKIRLVKLTGTLVSVVHVWRPTPFHANCFHSLLRWNIYLRLFWLFWFAACCLALDGMFLLVY